MLCRAPRSHHGAGQRVNREAWQGLLWALYPSSGQFYMERFLIIVSEKKKKIVLLKIDLKLYIPRMTSALLSTVNKPFHDVIPLQTHSTPRGAHLPPEHRLQKNPLTSPQGQSILSTPNTLQLLHILKLLFFISLSPVDYRSPVGKNFISSII